MVFFKTRHELPFRLPEVKLIHFVISGKSDNCYSNTTSAMERVGKYIYDIGSDGGMNSF